MNRASSIDRTLTFVGCAIATFGLPLQLFASLLTTNVSIIDFAFSPSAITISANESVVWTWAGASVHSSSSDTGLWDSGILSPGSQFTNAFPTAGTFPYHCNVHSFMTGSVTVQAQVQTNAPPAVSLASPANGATFPAPWTGTITATDSDSDGTVTNLQFFAGTTLLGTVPNPPATASFTVTSLPAGTYSLKAVATDNGGASTTSGTVSITVVAPSAPQLSAAKRISNTSFQFNYSALSGSSYIVLRSSDLIHWNPLATNVASTGSVTFTDPTATAAAQFYKVELK